MEKENEGSIRAVSRALKIIRTMEGKSSMSLSEISRAVDLPKTTALRLLTTLCSEGFVTKTGDDYQLSMLMFRIGMSISENYDVVKIADPVMTNLNEMTSESISINIVADHKRLCLEKKEGKHDLRQFIRVGELLPLHKGASGKAMLAFLPQSDREHVLAEVTDMNEAELAALAEDLERIRKVGLAVTFGERALGSVAIAAPVFNMRNEMVGSLGLSGAAARFDDELVEKYSQLVLESAQQVSCLLGYRCNK